MPFAGLNYENGIMNIEQGLSNDERLLSCSIPPFHFKIHHSLFDIRYSQREFQVAALHLI